MSHPLAGARPIRLRLALGAGLAAAACLAAAPTGASAAFTTPPCNGSSVNGIGASFQTTNKATWIANFENTPPPSGCAGASGGIPPSVGYNPAGSGAGRRSLGESGDPPSAGNPRCARATATRFGSSDEPPSATQKAQMENGETVSGTAAAPCTGGDLRSTDNGILRVIPVVQGAIPIVVNMPRTTDPTPTICQVDPASSNSLPSNATGAGRFKTTNDLWEKAWAGDITTWGQLVPGITGTGCSGQPIVRAVREDSSGTTFAFKDWLLNVQTAPRSPNWNSSGLVNQRWPADPGPSPTETATFRRGPQNQGVAAEVNANQGSIGYVELSIARQQGFDATTTSGQLATAITDATFWVPLADPNNTTFEEPTHDPLGYRATAVTRGANCRSVAYRNIPGGADPTAGDWGSVTGVNSAGTGSYGTCSLSYDLAFDDNAVVFPAALGTDLASEETKARTLKDFLFAELSEFNQVQANNVDYARLPTAIHVLAIQGVDKIGFNKAGDTPPPGPNPPPPPGGPGPSGTPGGGSAPAPGVSQAGATFTISGALVESDGSIRMTYQTTGAGALDAIAQAKTSAKKKKGKRKRKPKAKTIVYGRGVGSTNQAGPMQIVIQPSAQAKAALRKGALKVDIVLTFRPASGAPSTQSRTVSVKLKPRKKKKKK